jgi:hypothetical protein
MDLPKRLPSMTNLQLQNSRVQINPRTRLKAALPFLVGIGFGPVTALHFLNHNFDLVFPGDVIGLLPAVSIFSLMLYGLSYFWLRDRSRAGILAAATIYLSLNYDGFYLKFARYVYGDHDSRLLFTLPILLIIIAIGRLSQRMSANNVKAIENVLGLAVSALLVMNCWFVAAHFANSWGVKLAAANQDIVRAADQAGRSSRPDIYYIMPDDYVGNISLSETYRFDNQSFVHALEALGYYVPSQSFSNYPITTTSLASSLNGGLLEPGPDYRTTSRTPAIALIQKPEVAKFLQKQGYFFTQLGSWWYPTQTSHYADRVFRYGYSLTLFGHPFHISEFTGVFISRTIVRPWLERGLRIRGLTILAWQDIDEGQIFLKQDQELREIVAEGGQPKFVFAHLLMPHLPVVFDSDGKTIPKDLSPTEAYLRQVQFTNQKLIELANSIQATERGRQAVVVFASDEGQFPDDDTINGSDQQLRHKSNTFAALYFSDNDYSRLYPSITPVNYFRVIFNKYFGTRLGLQPDIVYAYRTSNLFPLDLADVTKRVLPVTSGGLH